MENRSTGRRGLWLALCLIYTGLSNVWRTYRFPGIYLDLVSHHDPHVPRWPFLLLGILSAIAMSGIIGLWYIRTWGVYLYLACWAGALAASIALHVSPTPHLLSLVGLVSLCVVLRPERGQLLQRTVPGHKVRRAVLDRQRKSPTTLPGLLRR